MNCDGVRGLLSAYVDGELSPGDLLRVEQHLRHCHWCADEVDALRQTIALVASLEEVPLPAGFHAQLHNRLVACGIPLEVARRAKPPLGWQRSVRRWVAPAAAAAVLVVGWAGFQRMGPEALPPKPTEVSVVNPGQTDLSGHGNQGNGESVATGGDTTPTKEPVGPSQPGHPEAGGTALPENPPQGGNPPSNGGGGEPVSTDPQPGTPGGNSGGIHTASVSYLDDVKEPGTLPSKMRLGAQVNAVVANPAAVHESLRQRYPTGSDADVIDPEAGTIQVQLQVSAADYPAALSFVTEQVGGQAGVRDTSVERANLIDDLYSRLASAEAQRKETNTALETMTDAAERERTAKFLATLDSQAAELKQELQILYDQVANGTITIRLTKPTPQAQ